MFSISNVLSRDTDTDIYGIQFHSYVLEFCSEPYTTHPNLIDTIECENPVIWQEFKDLIYGVKKEVSNELNDDEVLELYKIFEYLLINSYEPLFYTSKSITLLLYLIKKYDHVPILAICMYNNIIGKIDFYVDEILYQPNYLFRLFTDEIQCLYRKNIQDSKNELLRYFYATSLLYGNGGPKDEKLARQIYKELCDEYKNTSALHGYARMLKDGIGGPRDEVLARQIYKELYDKHKNASALTSYAILLRDGVGGPKDEILAQQIFKDVWDEHKNASSLYHYATGFMLGKGVSKDETIARQLYKQSWEETQYQASLIMYVKMLREGKGGPVDDKQANELNKFIKY